MYKSRVYRERSFSNDALGLLLGLTWGRRPAAHTSAYGVPVPSRWDEAPRAAKRIRRAVEADILLPYLTALP